MLSFLYALARFVAWTRAWARLAQGNPRPLLRRIRNKYLVYRPLNRLTRH